MRRLLTTILLCTASIASLYAWNGHGHATIAYVAEQNLTPKARQMCHHYLRHTLSYYASWMDQWRYCKGYEESRAWHAVRVTKDNVMSHPNRTNAITQIHAFRHETKNYRRMSDSIVMDNIKFLIHMVGDVHCPAHMFYFKLPAYKQDSVKVNGREMRYHDFLDGAPSRFHKNLKLERYHALLEKEWGHEKRAAAKGTAEEWMAELAVDSKRMWELLPNNVEWNDLPAENCKAVQRMVERRLYIAGIRLAAVLNDIFKN